MEPKEDVVEDDSFNPVTQEPQNNIPTTGPNNTISKSLDDLFSDMIGDLLTPSKQDGDGDPS